MPCSDGHKCLASPGIEAAFFSWIFKSCPELVGPRIFSTCTCIFLVGNGGMGYLSLGNAGNRNWDSCPLFHRFRGRRPSLLITGNGLVYSLSSAHPGRNPVSMDWLGHHALNVCLDHCRRTFRRGCYSHAVLLFALTPELLPTM